MRVFIRSASVPLLLAEAPLCEWWAWSITWSPPHLPFQSLQWTCAYFTAFHSLYLYMKAVWDFFQLTKCRFSDPPFLSVSKLKLWAIHKRPGMALHTVGPQSHGQGQVGLSRIHSFLFKTPQSHKHHPLLIQRRNGETKRWHPVAQSHLSTVRRSGLSRTHSKAAMCLPLLSLLVSCGHH